MKVTIIKRKDREKAATDIPAACRRPKSDEVGTVMAANINSWIVELRQKRDDEQILVQQLFKAELSC